MKKIVSIIAIFLVLFLLTFSIPIYGATLNNLNIDVTKQTVHPGENVTLNIAFGQELGAYTAHVAYDNHLLDYVSVEGGTANDTGSQVIVTYYYNQGVDVAARSNMSITFKAKEGIVTSNPTDLSITLTGLGTPDATPIEDITTPIIKNIMVEPVYVDYNIALNYTGNVIPNEEKDMEIVLSSSMGKHYEHTRIIAEVVAPQGEQVKLLAIDGENLEHDIIQNGWGSADGDGIGGKDVVKRLQTRGIFTGIGDYSITLKLIDRENSDSVIASKTFQITVGEKAPEVQPDHNEQVPPVTGTENNTNSSNTTNTQKPQTLPKTGNTIYFAIIPVIAILVSSYVLLRKKD